PATFNPARARGRTATPPAAPNPTTATSTGLSLMAMRRRSAQRLDSLAHLLFIGSDGEARAGIADEVPSGESPIPAVRGVAERAFYCELAQAIKKRPRGGFDLRQNSVLIDRREFDEWLVEFLACRRVDPIESIAERFVDERCDVVRRSALFGAGALIVWRE